MNQTFHDLPSQPKRDANADRRRRSRITQRKLIFFGCSVMLTSVIMGWCVVRSMKGAHPGVDVEATRTSASSGWMDATEKADLLKKAKRIDRNLMDLQASREFRSRDDYQYDAQRAYNEWEGKVKSLKREFKSSWKHSSAPPKNSVARSILDDLKRMEADRPLTQTERFQNSLHPQDGR